MSEDLFKLFDEVKARYEGDHGEGYGCKHPNITDGVCDSCWVVLWYELVNDEDCYNRTTRRGNNSHNREVHFANFLDKLGLGGEMGEMIRCDFYWFLRTYNRVKKHRKNFLLNKWVHVVATHEQKGV